MLCDSNSYNYLAKKKLTVEQHTLAGCGISVRTMKVTKGLHSSDEENAYIGVHRNQNKMC